MPVDTIVISPLTPSIGAEVHGIDLREPMGDEVFARIERGLMDHGVLFFRDQDLTDDQHIDFASRFAPVNHSAFAPPDAIGNDRFVEWLHDSADSPPKADLWHTDVAFRPEPPIYAVLNCREAPPSGGDTLWLSLSAAYERLSPVMQSIVDNLELDVRPARAEVQGDEHHRLVVYRPDFEQEGCVQPLVRTHPVTKKKALFMCGQYMNGIVGMRPDESLALLNLLSSGLNDPVLQCRWRWRNYDLVIWDERCTNHRALSDHYPQHRLVRRCTAGAERPVGPAAPGARPDPHRQ